jgi:anti-anti-sigma regulatory factor
VPVRFDADTEPGLIRLEGEVDISQADELKRILLATLAEGRALRLSAEAVTGMDITAMQLLWAAAREARTTGTPLAWQGAVPDALRATMREAGIDSFLGTAEARLSSEVR